MRIVIIGAVAGGASAAARARRLSEEAEIILVERGEAPSFANCGLPYYVGGVIEQRDKLLVAPAQRLIERFRLDDDAQVRMLSDDVAVIAYKVQEELTVDGEPVRLEATDSSTWIRRNGEWLCAHHTEALKGDPFGRDRAAPRA